MADAKELKDWKSAPQKKVRSSRDPIIKRLLEAGKDGEFLDIVYSGGSTPGATRSVMPIKLFKVRGYDDSIYLEAFCDLREDNRVFRLDKLELVSESLSPTSSSVDLPRAKAKRRQSPKRKKRTAVKPNPATTHPTTRQKKPEIQSLPESKSGGSSFTWLFWLVIGFLVLFAIF